MKITGPVCLAVLLCCVGSLAEPKPHMRKIMESGCLEKMGITMDDLHNARQGNADELKGKIACFHACFMKHTGLMSDNTINRENAHEHVNGLGKIPEDAKTKMHEKIETCADEAEKLSDECEIANSFFECSFPKPTHGPLPEE